MEAQHRRHGADVLGQLIYQGLVCLHELGVALRDLGADDPEIRGAQIGEHPRPAAQGLFDLVLASAGIAVIDQLVHRKAAGPVHTHGALVLDVEHVHHPSVVVGRHGHAAAQMTDDKVDLLIGSAQRRRSLPADGLLVQGVELAQAAEIGKARVVGHVRHLVHAHRIHEKGGDAHHVADAPGQIRPQVGGVLAVGRGLHVVHDPVVDGVGAGGDGPVQAAPAAHGGKVRQPKAALRHGVQNGLLAEVRLVNDPVEPVQLLGRVVDALFEQLLLLVENGDLGAGSAGVDDQYLHRRAPLRNGFSPNNLMNSFIMAVPFPFVNGDFRGWENLVGPHKKTAPGPVVLTGPGAGGNRVIADSGAFSASEV